MPRPCLFLCLLLLGQPLHAATVRQVIGQASAAENTELLDGSKFTTGSRSKSDVSLSKGFFRVGSDTGVQVVTSNQLSLEKGIMLAGSNPGRFLRPSVNIQAPGYKMQLKGTAQIACYPGHYMKITVLEGSIRVALQSLTGEWETLEPGQMLIISPSDKRLPEPVEVDISRLAATSQLIGGAFAELSTQGLINDAAAAQGLAFSMGDLVQTPFQFTGASPEVGLSLANRKAAAENQANALTPDERSVFNLVNDLDNPNTTVVEKPFNNGVNYSAFPGVDDLGNPISDFTLTRSGAKTQKLTVALTSAVDDFGQYSGPAEISGRIRADPDVFAGSNRTLHFQSTEFGLSENEILTGTTDYALYVLPGADIETPSGVALHFTGELGLTIEDAALQAGSGTLASETLLLTARIRALTVTNSQLKGGNVTLTGSTRLPAETQQDITVENSHITAQRNVSIGLAEKRTAITLRNSSQLAALVGAITIQSKGGPISIDTSTLTAGGMLTLDTKDPATLTGSPIGLSNATLSADIIRARGYSAAGDALLIDGSSFTAASLIKLYAEGASALRFKNHVQLTTPHAILAGQTVIVDPGGSVSISGQGSVFTDSAQFNIPGRGTLSAGSGLMVAPHAQKPSF